MTKILIFGVSGMLGNAVLRVLSSSSFQYEVKGTVRSSTLLKHFSSQLQNNIICDVDINDSDSVLSALADFSPDVVINCTGLVKQLEKANNPLVVLPINSLFPHRLVSYCALIGARLIQISTDCVFSGSKGFYKESDIADARDIYGVSKHIGEVLSENAVTLRTSIIGHELDSARSLVDWFLSERNQVRGYKEAYFSGLPTNELAYVIGQYVIPSANMTGLYHVASSRISKYDLLRIISEVYAHDIDIVPDNTVRLDRSLDSSRFDSLTGYRAPDWMTLILGMKQFGSHLDVRN